VKAQVERARALLNKKRPEPIQALQQLKPFLKNKQAPWPVFHFAGIAAALLEDHQATARYMQLALDNGGDEAETWHTLSVAQYKLENYEDAENLAREALSRQPDFFKALLNLGLVLQAQAKLQEALHVYQRANALDPRNVAVAFHIGMVYKNLGDFKKSMELFDIAIKMDATYEGPVVEKGVALKTLREFAEAETLLREFLTRYPNSVAVRTVLADTLKEDSRYDEAVKLYEEILKDNPRNAAARVNYGLCLQEMARYDEAEREYELATVHSPELMEAMCNYLMVMHYNPNRSAEVIFEAHRKWDKQFAPGPRPERPVPADRSPDRRLRVGFVSGGFRAHPVGWMITRGLEELPRDQFEVYCYTTSNVNDFITKRIHARADVWRPTVGYKDDIVARMVREDEIDILVELSGHAADNRLRAVAQEPAPVIVKWVGGLFNTTGLRSVDYLISDWFETPEGVEDLYTEKLVRMPDDYICFMPPEYSPEVSALPALENGYVTFGCFNNPSKVNPELVSQWARLMERVPGSRLFLKSGQYSSAEFQERIRGWMAEHGIDADRIMFEGRSSHDELLGTYGRVDVALDPWPYSGGLSTCEALWMGVPVVTLPGPTFAGRHSVTHLMNAGLPGMVAGSWDEYVDIAAGLASDLDTLAALRAGLRDQVAASPLCDGERFGAALSQALRAMWHAYADGRLKQDHIAVDLDETRNAVDATSLTDAGKPCDESENGDLRTSKSFDNGQNDVFTTGHDVGEIKTDAVAEDDVVSLDSKKGENTLASLERQATAKLNGDVDDANRAETQNGSASEVEYLSEASSERTDISENLSGANGIAKSDDTDRPELEGTTEEHTEAKSVSLPVNVSDSTDNSGSGSTDEEIEKVARVPWERGNHKNLLVHGNHAIKYSVPGSLEVMSTYVLLEQGQWFDGEVGFVSEYLQPGMQVVDVGAGFGAYALGAALKVGSSGKVYAFEPVDIMRKHLDISKVENGLNNLEVSARALGALSTKMGLSKNATPELTVLESGGGEVQVVTLDNWWDFAGNPQLDVIKIDVNGHEADVLKGADRILSTTSPMIVIAVSGTGPVQESTVEHLTSKGYTFFDYISGVGVLSPVEDWSQRDAYAQNVVAVKAERVTELKELGWIHNENIEVGEPEMGYWKKTLKAMPWTESLFADWEKNALVPGHKNYYKALDYICAAEAMDVSMGVGISGNLANENTARSEAGSPGSHNESQNSASNENQLTDPNQLTEKRRQRSKKAVLMLVATQELISKYNNGVGGLSVAYTLVRILNTLGKRDQAVSIMQKLMQDTKMGQENLDVSLPFLLPIPAMDSAPIRTEFNKWLMVRTLESWLQLKDLTGYLSAPTETKIRKVLVGNPECINITNSRDFVNPDPDVTISKAGTESKIINSVITIGIPCYNEAAYIEQCLSSVLNQKGNKNYSVVIADNASTDGTVELIKAFLKRNENLNSRTRLILNSENKGPLATFSQVYEAADTQFFMWLGAHDCLTPDFLSETLPLIESNLDCSMATGIPLGINFNHNYTDVGKIYRIPNASYNFTHNDGITRYIESIKFLGNCTVFHSIFRKSALNGYDFKDTPSWDHIIISRLLWQGKLLYSKAGYIRRYFPQEIINQKIVSGSYTKGLKFFNQYLDDFEYLINDRYDETRRSELLEVVNKLLLQRFGNPQLVDAVSQ
jgi:FkbM family methyltransferase